MGEDTGGGADEVGAAGVVGDERDDENGGVGQGDLAGHGRSAGQGRALQLRRPRSTRGSINALVVAALARAQDGHVEGTATPDA